MRPSPFLILSEEEIERVHLATLEALDRTGVQVQDDRALQLLRQAGAHVSGERVRIPPHLIDQALHWAPRRVVVCSREGKRAMFLEDSRVYYGTGSDCFYTHDVESGERRSTVRADTARSARLCDALPNIDFVMSMGVANDVPPGSSFVHQHEAMLANTTKPIIFTAHDERDLRVIYEMSAIVAGGPEQLRRSPSIILYSEPISPLVHTEMGLGKVIFCAERGIPHIYIPSPMTGATGPVTLAGSLVQANASCLSGLLVSQLVAKGAPFIYGADISIMDMRTTTYAYGAPELNMLNSALAQLGRHYSLPVFCIAGASDSKELDAQAGIEMAMSLLISTLNGANIVHDLGYLESGLTSSLEGILLCDEIVDMVKRNMRGIEISDETLALDVIDRVGPGGHFLSDKHTLKHFRKEQWYPRWLSRSPFDIWATSEKPKLRKRLNEGVREVLSQHIPTPLPQKARDDIDALLARDGMNASR